MPIKNSCFSSSGFSAPLDNTDTWRHLHISKMFWKMNWMKSFWLKQTCRACRGQQSQSILPGEKLSNQSVYVIYACICYLLAKQDLLCPYSWNDAYQLMQSINCVNIYTSMIIKKSNKLFNIQFGLDHVSENCRDWTRDWEVNWWANNYS